jgi:hypothetical protein
MVSGIHQLKKPIEATTTLSWVLTATAPYDRLALICLYSNLIKRYYFKIMH